MNFTQWDINSARDRCRQQQLEVQKRTSESRRCSIWQAGYWKYPTDTSNIIQILLFLLLYLHNKLLSFKNTVIFMHTCIICRHSTSMTLGLSAKCLVKMWHTRVPWVLYCVAVPKKVASIWHQSCCNNRTISILLSHAQLCRYVCPRNVRSDACINEQPGQKLRLILSKLRIYPELRGVLLDMAR